MESPLHNRILPHPTTLTTTQGAHYRRRSHGGQQYTTTGVYPPNATDATAASLDTAGALILDFDHPKKEQLRDLDDDALAEKLAAFWSEIEPTLPAPPTRVACSGYGFHVYYWLDYPVDGFPDLAVVQRANRQLVAGVPLADQGVHDAGTRILRPLGTRNTKNQTRPRDVELVVSNDIRYTIEQLAPKASAFEAIANAKSGYRREVINFADWTEPVRVHGGEPSTLIDLVNAGITERIKLACPVHNGRSDSSAFLRLLDGVPALSCTSCEVTWRHADGIAVELARDKHGKPRATVANVVVVLSSLDLFYLDLMDGRTWVRNDYGGRLYGQFPRPVSDVDITLLIKAMRDDFDLVVRPTIVFEAVAEVAAVAACHPLREELDGFADTWDGGNRLDFWLSDCCETVEDSEIVRAYSRKFILAMIARAYRPGCKFDNVLVLVGSQGARKSTLVQTLGGFRYVGEGHLDFRDNKRAVEKISGRWLYELAELDKYGSQDAARVKDFVTVTHDRERAAYGRSVTDVPRMTCFVGTSNRTDLLMDETGSRRFWIVNVGDNIDTDYLADIRAQLLGEAVVYWRKHKDDAFLLHLTPELEAIREALNADTFTARHHFCDLIVDVISRGAVDAEGFTSGEIANAIGLMPNDTGGRRYGIPTALKELGAVRTDGKVFHDGKRVRLWRLEKQTAVRRAY